MINTYQYIRIWCLFLSQIAEPGFTIIRVSATDIDSGAGGEVRYSINGGNADGESLNIEN